MTQYMVRDGKSGWKRSTAKSLTGAKVTAVTAYPKGPNAEVQVGIDTGDQIIQVATKRGFDQWVTDPRFK